MGKVPKTVQLKPVRLAVEVADRTGLTLRESEAAIDAVFAVIQDSLRSGLSVRLPKVGLLCTVLRYDSRWLNAGQPWAVKPAKRVEFRANQHFFREKRHRHTDLQPATSITRDVAGDPNALPGLPAGSV